VFWNVREAFLPPVTIEELEAVLESSTEHPQTRPNTRSKTRPAGTRGWYDNTSDRVNFIVPTFLTLIFIAIQILVVKSW
jgi:hypothetical protein